MTVERPDVERELAHLKGFQRRAAEHAFERLFTAPDSTSRFLIADEVGLGKTLIARGITALAIDHLWESDERIDVVYVCSNASIARQNVRRLGFGGLEPVDRLTLLPITVQNLEVSKLNFIAITPGTSLEKRSSMGIRQERQLLYHLLNRLWPVEGVSPFNLLQGHVTNTEGWRESTAAFADKHEISPVLQKQFHDELIEVDERERAAGLPGLRTRWEDACHRSRVYRRHPSPKLRELQRDLIGEFRTHLARCCIDALEPDLVILDEFQRFKHLLDPEEGDEAGELARRLFEWSSESAQARVLMLSATPYKMYTLAHEREEDDHYEDFLRTVAFLQRTTERKVDFERRLADYRSGLFRLAEGDGSTAIDACRSIEAELRRVMSRTERTAATGRRDGMVRTVTTGAGEVAPRDLVDFVALDGLARELRVTNVIEVWKSAPYLLSFSEGYELDKRMQRELSAESPNGVATRTRAAHSSFLQPSDVEEYQRLDPANARLRALLDDVVESGLWRCLWLPPSAPTYRPSGAYAQAEDATKRLVFSAWQVVPRVISALISYEVERRAFATEGDELSNTPEAREKRKPLLRFARSSGRLTGLPLFALMFPSAELAALGDARRYVRRGGTLLERDDLLAHVAEAIRERLEPCVERAPREGNVDEAWYWVAPILLDLETSPGAQAFWDDDDLVYRWMTADDEDRDDADDDGGAWGDHVAEARSVLDDLDSLGRIPDDLYELLAEVAVGAPATAALRALGRVLPGASTDDVALRFAAGRIAWGFRTLFNRPESTAIVRGRERTVPLWRMVLRHCVDGNLGDVLDEHVHLLREFEGLFDEPTDIAADGIAASVRAATSSRTTRTSYRSLSDDGERLELEKHNLRGHYALRFGADETEGEGKAQRADQVRTAFNSPFWPFVLASTSVGQEGLDFHAWCHAIVHWNLPSNPVDLEQREGRVHRYKGHAVRKNVALRHAAEELATATHTDPWAAMFERARLACADECEGLVPYWVFEADGGAHIERHVPALPHSKDSLRFVALQKALALYRMVFGQPRQDDLMAFLMQRVPEEVLEPMLDELRVDLAPRAVRCDR